MWLLLRYVEPEGLERTYRLKQEKLAALAPVAAAMSVSIMMM